MSRLEGYAVAWDDTAEVDGRPERFEPYAFLAPIHAKLVVAHDLRPGAVLARTSRGLQIDQDDHGVWFQAELDDADPDCRRALAAIHAGLNGCSFTFRAVDLDDGPEGVVVHRARLSEISLCSDPAYARAGCWPADANELPPRLAELRRHWQARSTANRPGRIEAELAAFGRARRWSASLIEPAPQARAAGPDPLRRLAGQYVARYAGGRR